MNAKRQKLQNQFVESAPEQPDKEGNGRSNIFAGVAIHVNGYTSKDFMSPVRGCTQTGFTRLSGLFSASEPSVAKHGFRLMPYK